jgi:hypothetical protein
MATRRAAWFAAQFGDNLSACLDEVSRSAVAGRWQETLAMTVNLHHGTRRLREEAITDALDAGADWWALGQVLGMHPQAAYDRYASLHQKSQAPVRQRPRLAVVYTAGLVGTHLPYPEYGVDLEYPAVTAGIEPDPRAEEVRAAAEGAGHHAWIMLSPPARHATGVPLDVLSRWTSVLRDDVELARLTDALAR